MEIRGLGTLVNVLCILLGGLVGYLAGNRLREPVRETLMALMGVGVMVLGLAGALAEMLTLQDGKLVSGGTIMLIVSLGAGGVIGEALRLEDQVLRFGTWLKVKSRSSGDNTFVEGFVTASCTVCIGAMAVIGSIQDGIWGDWSVLAAKGVIDAILVCVMAAAQGKGCGTRFVKFYMELARQMGCACLRIDTNARNQVARRLYAKLGFREAGVIPTCFNGLPGVDLVCLEKKL